ncbi:MAG: hypothetical protein ACI8Q9_002054, partial [Planctomycetota bacterium]
MDWILTFGGPKRESHGLTPAGSHQENAGARTKGQANVEDRVGPDRDTDAAGARNQG